MNMTAFLVGALALGAPPAPAATGVPCLDAPGPVVNAVASDRGPVALALSTPDGVMRPPRTAGLAEGPHAVPDAVPDPELRALYESGRDYRTFLSSATRRTELWHRNTERAEAVDADLVARARAVSGSWRFLVVAVDSCSDSVSTIPYLAELVSLVDGLELRIVDSTVGRSVMEAHRTPDGRAATPTVLLLDEAYDEVGCFIERPPSLQTWILENREEMSSDDIFEWKMDWYAEDSGRETLESFVAMLKAAARGQQVCG